MKPWQTLSRTLLLAHSKYLRVEEHKVALPDGRVIERWPWVIVPDYTNVLPRTLDGRYLVFRQTKYAASGLTLATVGGMIDPGEDPLASARRELLEETGYTAAEWICLGRYAGDGNRGVSIGHLFLARGAQPVAARNADDLEEQELIWMTQDELRQAALDGKFQVASWAATVALALLLEN